MPQLLYAPFDKVEALEDGTLRVFGVASSESEDSDGETVKADAVRKALPDYLTFGAVREMHQPIAAGTAIEARVDDDGITHFGAHVVDASSVLKVKTGVLKGFSLGGKVTKRNKDNRNIIEGLKLNEVSLVDKPANPDSVITLVKFDSSGAIVDQTNQQDAAKKKGAKGGRKNAAAKGAATDDLKKGMYDISRLADIISSLDYLQRCCQNEKEWEGDDSQVPDELRTATVTICRILVKMVSEETAELLGLDDLDDDTVLESAAKCAKAVLAGDLAKAGRKFSKASAEAIGDLHKMALDMCDKFDSLGYKGADNPEDQDMADNSNKGAGAGDDLQKMQTRLDTLEKKFADQEGVVTGLKDELAKSETARTAAEKERDDLTKGVQEIVEQAQAKGTLRLVGKEDDAAGAAINKGAETKKEDKPTDVGDEIRKSWKNPRQVMPATGTGTR